MPLQGEQMETSASLFVRLYVRRAPPRVTGGLDGLS
jgi:hypothetical protein